MTGIKGIRIVGRPEALRNVMDNSCAGVGARDSLM